MNLGYKWLNIIQDCWLPPTCLLCGGDGDTRHDLCQPCRLQLPWNPSCCYRCAAPLPAAAAPQLCGRCLAEPPAFDEAQAPFLYQGAVRHLLARLKFNADYPNARLLGQLLAEYAGARAERPQCLLPVPMHPGRYQQRGLDHALEIARAAGRYLRLPVAYAHCKRRRATVPQSGLAARQRRHNLRHAFAVVKPITAGHVAIIDDIMTTGATAEALALALKEAGVAKVVVWVCARA